MAGQLRCAQRAEHLPRAARLRQDQLRPQSDGRLLDTFEFYFMPISVRLLDSPRFVRFWLEEAEGASAGSRSWRMLVAPAAAQWGASRVSSLPTPRTACWAIICGH
jgi:hypothetical protein